MKKADAVMLVGSKPTLRKQDELHELWRYSSESDYSPEGFEALKRSVEVRLRVPFLRKLSVPSDSPLASSRSGSAIGASCVLPCESKQVVLCALRCGCLCMLIVSHGHKEFLFHESPAKQAALGTTKGSSKISGGLGASGGTITSKSSAGDESQQQRIERKRSELTAVASRPMPSGAAAVAKRPESACWATVACVLGTGLYLFDLDVMASLGHELRVKPQPTFRLPFKDDSTWYKSASVHFYANGVPSPLVLVALHAEGGGVVVGIFQRTGAAAAPKADYATRLPWAPLPMPAEIEAPQPSVVVFGFLEADKLLLVAIDGVLVLYSVCSDGDTWCLRVVGSLATGPLPITHGAMLSAKGAHADTPIHLVLVHGKAIIQSLELTVSVKRRREATGVGGADPKSPAANGPTVAVCMSVTLLSSFATYEVAVHDVDLQAPPITNCPKTVFVFAALETGAVIVLDLQTMRLVHRIAYKRLEISSRLRVNVWPNHMMLALLEDENASVYKASEPAKR